VSPAVCIGAIIVEDRAERVAASDLRGNRQMGQLLVWKSLRGLLGHRWSQLCASACA
jgi:hypothetical protein